MTLEGTNTWLLDGDVPALVDAGTGEPSQRKAIAEQLAGRPLARLLITHGHSDHSAGAAAFVRDWPAVEVCRWPIPDGEWISAGDRRLQVLHTPGHAADHICFWDPDAGDLYAGDMVIYGTTVMIPTRGGSLRAYLASLERMAALGPRRVFPGHGPIIERPLEAIRVYQRHRREREEQVRSCLAEGITAVEEIVQRLYRGLAPSILPAARETIQAHLVKLREDAACPPSAD